MEPGNAVEVPAAAAAAAGTVAKEFTDAIAYGTDGTLEKTLGNRCAILSDGSRGTERQLHRRSPHGASGEIWGGPAIVIGFNLHRPRSWPEGRSSLGAKIGCVGSCAESRLGAHVQVRMQARPWRRLRGKAAHRSIGRIQLGLRVLHVSMQRMQ